MADPAASSVPVLILIGAPAAGKGTVAGPFQKDGFKIISTGDLLREERKQGTDLGKKAQAVMDAGGLMPDDIMLEIVRAHTGGASAQGYIFDGFPRTAAQAKALDTLLSERGIQAQDIHVIRLDVRDNILQMRVKKRFDEAMAAGEMPRRDDDPEIFEKRLAGYKSYSREVCGYYGSRVHIVDGNHNLQETLRQVQLMTGILLPPAGAKHGPLAERFRL